MTKIFVYGTLKRGECRNQYLKDQTFISEAKTLPLYVLYSNGSFPALIRIPASAGLSVHGELWEVDDDCLRLLDCVEGHPNLFKRQTIEIENHDGIIAYYWQGSIEHLEYIGECWNEATTERR